MGFKPAGEVDMRSRGWGTALVLALSGLGCGTTMEPDQPGMSVPVERLSSGPYSLTYNSGLPESRTQVVRDQATWARVWTDIWRAQPAPALPPADFSREVLVVAALGQRLTGGYTILVDSAQATAGGITVTIRTLSP